MLVGDGKYVVEIECFKCGLIGCFLVVVVVMYGSDMDVFEDGYVGKWVRDLVCVY